MPTLYLFIGFPGAGKTTIAQALQRKTGAVHIWADLIRIQKFGNPTHSSQENKLLYQELNSLTEQLLAEGRSVIFDTNFNFVKDRQHLRNMAARHGADTVVVWVTTPKEIAKQRAVEESEGKDTRLYGNMSADDFERIAGHLQPPLDSEKVIKIDGTSFDERSLATLG